MRGPSSFRPGPEALQETYQRQRKLTPHRRGPGRRSSAARVVDLRAGLARPWSDLGSRL